MALKPDPKERGQVAILGILLTFVFTLLLIAMADFYRAWETRSWTYRQAASAAEYGASVGRAWAYAYVPVDPASPPPPGGECPGWVPLTAEQRDYAARQAQQDMVQALALRGLQSAPQAAVVEMPADKIPGFGNAQRRLTDKAGQDFEATYPALAVSGEVQVPTFLGNLVGKPTVTVTYWGAAAVVQPGNACPPQQS